MTNWNKQSGKSGSNFDTVAKTNDGESLPVKTKIAEMRNKLGIFTGFKFDRATNKEIARVAGELVVNQLNAEKEIAIDKIYNNVALGKRSNLKEYLQSVALTDQELLSIGEDTKKKLSDTMQAEVVAIVKEKKQWKEASEKLLASNEIETSDYDNLIEMHELEALELIVSKRDDRNTIRDTYRMRLEQALKEYVERNPSYK